MKTSAQVQVERSDVNMNVRAAGAISGRGSSAVLLAIQSRKLRATRKANRRGGWRIRVSDLSAWCGISPYDISDALDERRGR